MVLLVPYQATSSPQPYSSVTLPQFNIGFVDANGTLLQDLSTVALSATTTIGRTSNRTDGTANGQAQLSFDDTQRTLDPDNTTGPLYGKLTPGGSTTAILSCGVPGIGYLRLFTGLIDSIDTTWPDGPTWSQADLSLVDSQRDLTSHIPAANVTYPQQQTGARISALLGAQSRSGWGWNNRAPTRQYALDAGQKVLGPLTTDGTTDTWSYVAQSASAEEGLVFFDQNCIPTFHDQQHRARQSTPAWVFGENTGELHYESDITLSLPNDRIVVDQAYTTTDGITSGYGSGGAFSYTSSKTNPQPSASTVTTPLIDAFAGAARARSDYRRFSVNRRDAPTVTIDAFADWPTVTNSTSNRAWAALNVKIGDLVTVNRRPGIGSTISKNYYIEAIKHAIAPGSWKTTFYLVSVDLSVRGWVLGTSKLGSLQLTW